MVKLQHLGLHHCLAVTARPRVVAVTVTLIPAPSIQ